MPVEQVVKDQKYYLTDIKNSLHRVLNDDQERALKLVLDKIVRVPSPKIIDLNIPFWLIKRFYIQIYFGHDKRTSQRKERDKFDKTRLKEYKERNADFYFAGLPEDIQSSFNYEEKNVIMATLARAISIPSKKIIESNINFKLKQKYYLAFYLGFDRRKGRRSSASSLMNKLSFLSSAMIYLLVILFVMYFAKTVLNYDFIPDSHGIDYLIEKLGLNK
jgi:hypothetical protein